MCALPICRGGYARNIVCTRHGYPKNRIVRSDHRRTTGYRRRHGTGRPSGGRETRTDARDLLRPRPKQAGFQKYSANGPSCPVVMRETSLRRITYEFSGQTYSASVPFIFTMNLAVGSSITVCLAASFILRASRSATDCLLLIRTSASFSASTQIGRASCRERV